VFVAGGRQIVVTGGRAPDIAFSVLDTTTAAVVYEVPGPEPGGPANRNIATSLAASPDRSLIAVTFGRVGIRPAALYATKDWKELRVFDGIPFAERFFPRGLAFDGSGRHLAFAMGRNIMVVNAETGTLLQQIAAPNAVDDLAFSADGSAVAAIVRDSVVVFQVADAKEVASYPHGGSRIAWDPHGRFVAIYNSGVLHLWNPFGPPVSELTIQLRPGSSALAITSDGGQMAVANGSYISVFEIAPR
jgi:hypothetical protein